MRKVKPMSIKDLDLILKKDPVISTWPARALCETPEKVEQDYLVHARTHIPLGDTTRYVDTIFKWVSGVNKGAFIGAVLGDYGEGKTSFLVHIWAQSRDRKVLAVPPFEWSAFEEIVDAVTGWVRYLLESTHRPLARRVDRIQQTFRRQTAQEIAGGIAASTGQGYDAVLATVQAGLDGGQFRLTEMSAARLLDLVAETTDIVREAGYEGLVILLDEPEVAAKRLSSETVQLFLFDLANRLNQRQGNYGVFVSMPANFFASAQARFSALGARLEVRGCFPSLGDIYGADFAETLWSRYVQEFDLGKEGRQLVSPLALQAMGQVGSSDHKYLAYGPRSVVSAFRRMVDRYQSSGKPYEPLNFVRDVLDEEILVRPEYRSRILSVLRSPDLNDENREAVTLLAAFPSGLRTETLREMVLEDILRPLARPGGLVRRTAFTMGLRALRGGREVAETTTLLADIIGEIDSEFAPDRRAFESALSAFVEEVIPLIFAPRKGQQLVGWQTLRPLVQAGSVVRFCTMMGAFQRTERDFPSRAVMVLVSSVDASLDGIDVPQLDNLSGPQTYDLLFHFALRWHEDQDEIGQMVEIRQRPAGTNPALIRLHLGLNRGLIQQDHLSELVGANRLTPFWVLNLFHCMERVELGRESQAEWRALGDIIRRQLPSLLLGEELSEALAQAAQEKIEQHVPGSGLPLLENVAHQLLRRRYPAYKTLIRQPHWQGGVDSYINALSSSEVPLACKRGREPWKVQGKQASRVLGAGRMNLTGGAFTGLESLIEVKGKGRQAPLEITFRIHPLEEEIRNLIMAQGTGPEVMLKREGKDCPYLAIEELLPVLQKKGYTVEELGRLIQIGQARKSFEQTTHRHERVLFCKPLDPLELKAQLRAKLNDLVEEIKLFKGSPDYESKFDPAMMEEAIEKVADDVDYDRLRTRMNKEFEQNHSRLPGYFDRVQEKLRSIRKDTKAVHDRLSGSRDVAQLKMPSATSAWGSALGRYIVSNLQKRVDELRQGSKQLLERIDQETMRFSFSRQHKPDENLALLREGWSRANDDEADAGVLCEDARKLLLQIVDFSKWCRLLRQSDDLYGRLMELQRDAAHQDKAEEFIGTFDSISQDISEHIQDRNVMGLPAHRQFLARFEDLERARQRYLAGLKSNFDKQKEKVNRLLEALNLDGRVRIPFNPMEVGGCYDQLFSDGARLIVERALDRSLDEISTQERELVYAREVLLAIEPGAAASLLTELGARRKAIGDLQGKVSDSWLRGIIENEDDNELQRVAQEISVAFEAVRAARKKVQEVTVATEPSTGRARRLHALLPDNRAIDLKELVLQMMAETADPSQGLEASLEGLAELFRRNCIQIRVERRRR